MALVLNPTIIIKITNIFKGYKVIYIVLEQQRQYTKVPRNTSITLRNCILNYVDDENIKVLKYMLYSMQKFLRSNKYPT